MATTIKLKNGSGAPLAGNLVQGEPALDLTNKRLYTEDSGGTVIEVGTNPTSLTTGTFTSTGIDDNATSTAITIDSSENVLVGGTSQSGTANKVMVKSADKFGLSIIDTTAQATGVGGALNLGGNYRTSGDAQAFTRIAALKDNSTDSNFAYSLGFYTTPNGGTFTERMRIDSSGNVGIGDTTPAAKLEVNGNVIAKTDTDTTNTGSVTLDFGANQNFVLTLTGNVTLANPSTEVVGQSGFIVFIQDGTGGRTVSLGTDYETAGGSGLTLSSAASTTDIVPYVVAASGRILLGAPQLAFS